MSDSQMKEEGGSKHVDDTEHKPDENAGMKNESQMDAKGGSDHIDAGGIYSDAGQQKSGSQHQQSRFTQEDFEPIPEEVYNSPKYENCPKIGKAVIVSNFMGDYKERRDNRDKDPECRSYALEDCESLQTVLKSYGFEPLDGTAIVHRNLTKTKFTELYKKAAEQNNYRPRGENGYTCVLFIVMSYGKPGLIKCHRETDQGHHEYVELKHLQEAFQPQNNGSLALKPKIFIIQTIPEAETKADAKGGVEVITTRRIPREADFLTYTCDSFCLRNLDAKEKGKRENVFVKSIEEILKGQINSQKNGEQPLEIQKLLIRINNEYKKRRGKWDDWKIPCVTSSLTKLLYLESTKRLD